MNEPTRFHLAQVNVAQLRAPLDSPQLAGFVARLDEINALADGSPGFVWRLQTEAGDATALRVFDDDRLLVNLSVWTSVKVLHDYVYRSRHVELIRDRKPWFEALGRAHYALWWIPAGTLPTVADAVQRLAHLQAHGPTPVAFDFQRPCAPTGGDPAGRADQVDRADSADIQPSPSLVAPAAAPSAGRYSQPSQPVQPCAAESSSITPKRYA